MASIRLCTRTATKPHLSCSVARTSHTLPHRRFYSSHATPNVDSARTYCSELLRKYDYPSHLLSAFVHPRARDAHLVIRAFNVDIARIEDQVSSVTVGRMRMQFWKDAIDKTYAGRPPAEPVALLLDKVLREDEAPLSKGFFRKVISSREQYLGNVAFPTLSALESYAEGTYSSLSYLALESFHQHSVTLDHIASHIGKATGITAILRGMPLLAFPPGGASAGAVVFPLDVCAEFDLRQEDILRQGSNASGLGDAVFKVATLANDHLITARKMLADSGEEGKGAVFAGFLSAVPTSLYLERLEAVDFDPFHQSLQKRPWKLPWRAYRAYSMKEF